MPTPATHVWRPSAARTITLDTFVPVPRGTTAQPPALASWPLKDPVDVLDYQFDIAPALVSNDGDAIATLDVAIEPANPGDLTLTSCTADGSKATLWLSGGQSGTIYNLTLTISTQSGRVIARSVLLPVMSLAFPPNSTNALLTEAGTSLTDQDGDPIRGAP